MRSLMGSSRKHDYQIAKEQILDLIVKGKYEPGDKIPTYTELVKMFKVGQISVQYAVKSLMKEGVLTNRRGSGCYVKSAPAEKGASGHSTDNEMSDAEDIMSFPNLMLSKTIIKVGLPQKSVKWYLALLKKIFMEFENSNSRVGIEIVEYRNHDELKSKILAQELDLFQIGLADLPIWADSGILLDPSTIGTLDFSADDFFKPFHDACSYNGIQWGIPLEARAVCLFCNGDQMSLADEIFPVMDLFDFLEKVEKMAGEEGFKAQKFILNSSSIMDFFYFSRGQGYGRDFFNGRVFGSPELLDFMKKIEKYLCDGRIFDRDIFKDPDHGKTVSRNLAAGSYAMVLHKTSILRDETYSKYWHVLPSLFGRHGTSELMGEVNVISSYSYKSLECLALINYLGSREVQLSLSAEGVLVAHREACENLRCSLDRDSVGNMLEYLKTGTVMQIKTRYESELAYKIYLPEAWKLNGGVITTDEFLKVMGKNIEILKKISRTPPEFLDGAGRYEMKSQRRTLHES